MGQITMPSGKTYATGLSREDRQFLIRLNRFARRHHWTKKQVYDAIHQKVRLGITPWDKPDDR